MDFYSNLIIFYQSGPICFGGKLTSFVAILTKNTCVCGCRPVLYYFKVNVSLLERFMKPGMGIIDNFLLQPRHFYQANPNFGGKSTSFVAALAQNTCVHGCRLVLYHLNFNISLLSRFTKPGMGIIDGFLLQPHHFLSN